MAVQADWTDSRGLLADMLVGGARCETRFGVDGTFCNCVVC
jgi:hypothetical protein